MKVLVHDAIGIRLCARQLHQDRFLWANTALGAQTILSREQPDALVLDLADPKTCTMRDNARVGEVVQRTIELNQALGNVVSDANRAKTIIQLASQWANGLTAVVTGAAPSMP